MTDVIIFGGTTEGRALAELLERKRSSALICVATEYGEALLEAGGAVRVRAGRLDAAGIERLLSAEKPRLVIDATHPYAVEASQNILSACEARGVQYIRVLREKSGDSGCVEMPDMETLTARLNENDDIVFSALGAKEVSALTIVRNYKKRIWLRVLPMVESLSVCLSAGFPAKHIICMQGPFSKELNESMFRASGAKILLTKESGAAGGFAEKLAAARACHMEVAVLARPRGGAGLTLEQIKLKIKEGVW